MIIEAVRLVITLALTAVGFVIGKAIPDWFDGSQWSMPTSPSSWVRSIGAGIGYVMGGLIGRVVRRGLDRAPDLVAKTTGPQFFAGTFGLLAGLLIGVVVAVPMILLLPAMVAWPLAALVVLVLASAGSRVFAARAGDLLAAAGIRTSRPPRLREPPAPDLCRGQQRCHRWAPPRTLPSRPGPGRDLGAGVRHR